MNKVIFRSLSGVQRLSFFCTAAVVLSVFLLFMGCLDSDPDPDHTHTWGDWEETTPATCFAPGEETRTCGSCDETETRPKDQLSGGACDDPFHVHNYGEWEVVMPATCFAAGQQKRTCSCDKDTTRTIQQLGAVECFAAGSQFNSNVTYDSFTDARNSQTYKTVKIGSLTWMAENLNYVVPNSAADSTWCYNNADSNCVKYGRLYNFNAAEKACPPDWRLPVRNEWNDLMVYVGGIKTASGDNFDVAGGKLKSQTGWSNHLNGNSGNGTDDYGFSALPGGFRVFNDGRFDNLGYRGYWWIAPTGFSANQYYRDMRNINDFVNDFDGNRNSGLSVRCVRN